MLKCFYNEFALSNWPQIRSSLAFPFRICLEAMILLDIGWTVRMESKTKKDLTAPNPSAPKLLIVKLSPFQNQRISFAVFLAWQALLCTDGHA